MRKIKQAQRPLGLVAVCAVVIVLYGSLFGAPPLIWDDEPHIFANPRLQQEAWSKAWTAPYFGMYIPVIYTIWKGLFLLGNGAVWPFRALNLLLHLANIWLFTGILAGLFRRLQVQGSVALLLGVAIFALHPLQTATVSWISGGRDLSAATFAMAAVCVYFGRSRFRLSASTLLYGAGLLCKPHIAAIPLAIILFVWLFERQRLRAAATDMSLWIALAVASAMITSQSQASTKPVDVPILLRPLVALDALGFHLLKSVYPFPMATDYGRTPDVVLANPGLMVPTLVTLALAVAALIYAVPRDGRLRFAFIWPVVLAPVLGLVPFAYQSISTVADHYNYLPLAVLGAVASLIAARVEFRDRRVVWATVSAVVVFGGATSWIRTRDWIGNERFFRDMLEKNPASYSAKLNLSTIRCERGDWQTGLPLMRETFAVDSVSVPILANLANCLFSARRFDETLQLQRRLQDSRVVAGLASNGRAAAILTNSLAGAFFSLDQPLKAFAYLCQGQSVRPNDAEIEANLGAVRRRLLERGNRVRCPGHLPWDKLPMIVSTLD